MTALYSEVRAVGQIRHEHVVTIHDSGRIEDGRPYLAMEFLEGEDLASHLKQHGPMQSARAMLLWRQAVSAVAAAHRRHVVHRDIKPANLFLTYKEGDEGLEEIIKVIDFSIAKIVSTNNLGGDSRPTEPGAIVGTVLYMAPEQLSGAEASPRSDVYSLGLVLMEMLTGKLPWGGARGDAVKVGHALQRLVHSPSSLRELDPEQPFSEELQQLASDVLCPEPMVRPADAGELLRRIKRLPEMRDWQRIPRRLSWPGSTERDADSQRRREAEPELAQPSELEIPKPLLDEDGPTAQSVQDSEPEAHSPSKDTDWSSSSSATEVSDWTEGPTVPTEGAPLEQQMRSLEAALIEESRRAQKTGIHFSGDTFLPVTRGNVVYEKPLPPSQRSQREDTSSSKGNVFSAADLDSHLEAIPDSVGEEPTLPSPTPAAKGELPPPASAPPLPVLRTPALVVLEDPRPLDQLTEPVRRRRRRRWLSSGSLWLTSGLGVAFLGWFVYRVVEYRIALVSMKPRVGLATAVADLGVRDAGAIATDASAAASSIADLSPPQDLYKVLTGDLADATAPEAGGLLRVRLFYNEDDEVGELSCAPQQGPPKTTTQSHRVTVRTTLLPGAVCTVSGPGGPRSYTYDQIAKHQPQHSGEIRLHVQGRPSSTTPQPPKTAASPSPPAPSSDSEPTPRASDSAAPVDGG